jgi:secreted PhoX family phosphatase
MYSQDRRSFLQFLGRAGILAAAHPLLGNSLISEDPIDKEFPIKGIQPQKQDEIILAQGLEYKVLVKWDDPISEKDRFGYNNDYLAYIPLDEKNSNEGLLWVNHEYLDTLFVSQYPRKADPKLKSAEQFEKEMYAVGGSILHIKKKNEQWELVKDSIYNRRITGRTKIALLWDEPIAGKKEVMGTFGNCAGGVTPWGTILTCEENYQDYYGDYIYENGSKTHMASDFGWEAHLPDNSPEHYGWVVEVDLKTGKAHKLIALGRCAHECAKVHQAKDGRLVVYTGDDKNDEFIYKFISSKPGSLQEGILYVANTEQGKWLSLDYKEQEILQKHFSSQTEVLIRVREAAKLVGATPQNRPEDIEIDPITGNVLITLTNNTPKGDYHGAILKIVEDHKDKLGLSFSSEIFLAGGTELGFACPDNMAFGPKGNLWFTSDMSGSMMNKPGPYQSFGNNGLFVFNPIKSEVIQVASAPMDAEFTGPYFSPDGKSLFLSVQHPGETSKSLEDLISHWPDGGTSIPRSSVVVISGPAFESLMK